MEVNQISLRGRALSSPVFSHESHGARFSRLPLAIPRLSGRLDELNLLGPEDLLSQVAAEETVSVQGQVRSYNNRSGVGSRLVITVFVQSLRTEPGPPENDLILTGVLCKPPIFRRTPLGREICDLMLAVPRQYGRADYLPCVAWGSTARQAAGLAVGDHVRLEGRLQSRGYVKNENGTQIPKVAYEVSISALTLS